MPQVLFENHARREATSRFMPVPKQITNLSAWYKTARQAIGQIPDLTKTDWYIRDAEATVQQVVFSLQNTLGARATVTIDRTKRGINT